MSTAQPDTLPESSTSNRAAETILHSAGEGILAVDRSGKIVFANPAAARMLQWPPQQLIGRSQHETLTRPEKDEDRYPWRESPIYRTLRDGTVPRVDEEVFRRKDGTGFPVEYTSTPIREGEEIVGAVITFHDITERRLLDAQLRQAQKLESIGQLAAGIAHEINTPAQYIGHNVRFLEDALRDLHPLLSMSRRLLQAAKEHTVTEDLVFEFEALVEETDLEYLADEMPEAIRQSLDGVNRVTEIVHSMKGFSESGQTQVDLNRAIENTLVVSRNEWKLVADVVTDFDRDLPPINCRPGELNQAILHLIVNAAHAVADAQRGGSPEIRRGGSPEKGTITVTTRRDGDRAEIRIADTGTGIPEEIRSRVFDPFFTSKEVGRGTGQGLAVARSVVTKSHGGTIDFETEVGRGTTFIIRLPICCESSPAEGG